MTALRRAIESAYSYGKSPIVESVDTKIIIENDLSDEKNSDLHKYHFKMGHVYKTMGHVIKESNPELAQEMFERGHNHHIAADVYGRGLDPELRSVRESDAKNSAMGMFHTASQYA